ncbi:MAG: hypothetical protein WCD44_04675, partial [Candidatus Babeliales bacterium]
SEQSYKLDPSVLDGAQILISLHSESQKRTITSFHKSLYSLTQQKRMEKNIFLKIFCDLCQQTKYLINITEAEICSSFKKHMTKYHPQISRKHTSYYMTNNIQTPNGSRIYSILCPLCKKRDSIESDNTPKIIYFSNPQLDELKKNFCEHIEKHHSDRAEFQTEESILEYIENFYVTNFTIYKK